MSHSEFLGDYRIRGLLGRGGMAEVLLASHDSGSGQEELFAVKRIRPAFAHRSEYIQLFEREVAIAARVRHPNIATYFDYVRRGNDRLLIMEFVHGRTLRSLIKAAASAGGLALEATLTIIRDIALALDHVHELRDDNGRPLGLIHRDLNPGNILIREDGAVKLVDFGISKPTEEAPLVQFVVPEGHTIAGGPLKGSFGYMSPEQCQCRRLDRRSDVFSLGVLLYEATLCRRAFRSRDGIAAMGQIVGGRLERPSCVDPSYPEGLEQIVRRALAANPRERFQTAYDFARALERFAHRAKLGLSQRQVAVEAHRLVPLEPVPADVGVPWAPARPRQPFFHTLRWARLTGWKANVGAAAAGIALGGSLLFIVPNGRSAAPPPRTADFRLAASSGRIADPPRKTLASGLVERASGALAGEGTAASSLVPTVDEVAGPSLPPPRIADVDAAPLPKERDEAPTTRRAAPADREDPAAKHMTSVFDAEIDTTRPVFLKRPPTSSPKIEPVPALVMNLVPAKRPAE